MTIELGVRATKLRQCVRRASALELDLRMRGTLQKKDGVDVEADPFGCTHPSLERQQLYSFSPDRQRRYLLYLSKG